MRESLVATDTVLDVMRNLPEWCSALAAVCPRLPTTK